jgi:hypothetical protein
MNSSFWVCSMMVLASLSFSTAMRCSYQSMASASSISDLIMRANVRTSCGNSPAGSWYWSKPIDWIFYAFRNRMATDQYKNHSTGGVRAEETVRRADKRERRNSVESGPFLRSPLCFSLLFSLSALTPSSSSIWWFGLVCVGEIRKS